MPKFAITRSITIAASADTVHGLISDFRQWPAWSPWLYIEPGATLKYVGEAGVVGHGYSWEGSEVGAGEMTLTAASETSFEMALRFIKPFKSKAAVAFRLEPEGDGTRVIWSMNSALPFFMFFMVGMMKTMISMDYDRGLQMLKDKAERGHIESRCERIGIVQMPTTAYVGVRGSAHFEQMSAAMERDFSRLKSQVSSQGLQAPGPFMSVYTKMNIWKGIFDYIAAVGAVGQASGDLVSGALPQTRAVKVVHTGRYDHIGNGWSVVMSDVRAKKLKMNKKLPALEVYLNDPESTPAAELITEIYVPIK